MRSAVLPVVLALLSIWACTREQNPFAEQPSPGGGTVSLSLGVGIGEEETRSILSDEFVDSGFYLMAFNHDTGNLEGCVTYGSRAGGTIALRRNVAYDFYVVGNMWYLDGSLKKTAADAGIRTELGIRNLRYRFGGVSVGNLKTEEFSDFAELGIPYAGSAIGMIFTEDASLNIPATYLFAKVNVTVDHGGLVNGDVADDVFTNSSLYVRGANSVVCPFGVKARASASDELLPVSDYSSSMDNADRMTFTYYVPENAQGTDTSVTDASLKTTEKKPFATYVEFATVVDGGAVTAGGYGGKITYQFCLGANATTDFNVLRNTVYDVSLSFKAGSLFSPCWKLGLDDSWNDTRMIRFSADETGTSDKLLPEGGTLILAVRKNRPAVCYVYFNRKGVSGVNERSEYLDYLASGGEGYNPSNVSRSGYSLEYDGTMLSRYGLALAYDSSSGRICVGYNPESEGADGFYNVPESGIPVAIRLHPGGKEVTALVKTYDNLGIGITPGDRYVGMKTTVTANGFAGNSVKLRSDADGVFRVTNSAAPDGSEGTDNYLDGRPVPCPSSGLDLWAYRDASSVRLSCTSDDPFNDGTVTQSLTVYKPTLSMDRSSCLIPVDGTEVDISYGYRNRNGEKMDETVFDSAVYSQLMSPEISLSDGALAKATRYCIAVLESGAAQSVVRIYAADLPKTTFGGRPTANTEFGFVKVTGRNSALFPSASSELLFRYPSLLQGFNSVKSNLFNEDRAPALESTARIDAAGCCTNPFGDGTGGAVGYRIVTGDDYGIIRPCDAGEVMAPCIWLEPADADGNRTIKWVWHPGTDIGQYKDGILAPWGERSVSVTYTNKHSNAAYTLVPATFDIKYQSVDLVRYCLYPVGDRDGTVWICSRLGAYLSSLWNKGRSHESARIAPPLFCNLVFAIYGRMKTMRDYRTGELDNFKNTGELSARYAFWALDTNEDYINSSPDEPQYDDIVWDDGLIYDQTHGSCYGLPTALHFGVDTPLSTTLPQGQYPGIDRTERQRMQEHIPVSCFSAGLYVVKY